MNKKWIPFFFLFCALLYFNQSYLFPSLDGLGAVFGVIMLAISVIFVLCCFKLKKKNIFFWSISVFLIMTLIWYIWPNYTIPDIFLNRIFKLTLLTLLPFFPFYYWGRNRVLLNNFFIIFFFINICVLFLAFYISKETVGDGKENVVLNISYVFVIFMPYLFLLRKHQFLSLCCFMYLIIMIFLSAKRGAIICAGAFTIFYFWCLFFTKTMAKSIALKAISFLAVSMSCFWIFKYFREQDFVLDRLFSIIDGNSSGRDAIYSTLFSQWAETTSLINLYFGFGYCASLDYTGSFAHSDWLELLVCFGLMGIISYLLFFYSFISIFVRKKYLHLTRCVCFGSFIIWFIQAAVSMSYASGSNFWMVALIAYLIGLDESRDDLKILTQ